MTRALKLTGALLAVVAVAMAFGWIHTTWFSYAAQGAREVLLAYAAAAIAVAVLYLAGQLLRVRGHAYYVIVAGLAFLAVDAAVWWRFGIMPGPKSYQDGFVPAAIMGLFLGPLYRIIAPAPRELHGRGLHSGGIALYNHRQKLSDFEREPRPRPVQGERGKDLETWEDTA